MSWGGETGVKLEDSSRRSSCTCWRREARGDGLLQSLNGLCTLVVVENTVTHLVSKRHGSTKVGPRLVTPIGVVVGDRILVLDGMEESEQ